MALSACSSNRRAEATSAPGRPYASAPLCLASRVCKNGYSCLSPYIGKNKGNREQERDFLFRLLQGCGDLGGPNLPLLICREECFREKTENALNDCCCKPGRRARLCGGDRPSRARRRCFRGPEGNGGSGKAK